MAYTIVGYSGTPTAADTAIALTAMADSHVKNEDTAIIVPSLNKYLGCYPIGQDIDLVQIISPSLRRVALLDISPVENGLIPAHPPDPIIAPEGAIDLDIDEELTVEAASEMVAAWTPLRTFIFLGDSKVSPITGKIFTVKAETDATTESNEWEPSAIDFTQSLPVGEYSIVGARLEKENALAFRFVFIGGVWRPGMVAVCDGSSKDVPKSRHGKLGVWGTFAHNNEPSLEICSDAAGAAGDMYIDLIKR